MTRKWLYKRTTSEGELFEGEDAIETALDSGEWAESPAECDGEHSAEGPGIGDPAIEDYEGLTVDDFKQRFTVKELRAIAKELDVKVTRQNTEDEIAEALVAALTTEPE